MSEREAVYYSDDEMARFIEQNRVLLADAHRAGVPLGDPVPLPPGPCYRATYFKQEGGGPDGGVCPQCGAVLVRANNLPRERQPGGIALRCDYCGFAGRLIWWDQPPTVMAYKGGSAMTRTQRVWDMINRLRQRAYTDAELCLLYGVSVRTIQSDRLLIATEPFYLNVERRVIYQIMPVPC